MTPTPERSRLERFLGLFAEVRAGEGIPTLLLTLNVFLLLATYYIIKPVREALILDEGSAELKSYLSLGQTALLLLVVPIYSRLAGALPRRALLNTVSLFFVACLVLFFALFQLGVSLSVVFFLWVGIFNLMIVAQFWSFANDLYTPEEGKRLFAIIAFGASAGAVVGSYALGEAIDSLGIGPLFLIAAGVLLAALVVTNVVNSRAAGRTAGTAQAGAAEEPVGKGDAFRLVLSNRYLLLIALLILFLNWVNTNGEYILGRVVEGAAEGGAAAAAGLSVGEYIGKFYSRFFLWVNVISLATQLFLVSRIFKYAGVRLALLVLPAIALIGNGIIALVPILAAVRWSKTFENATDYSLQNTLRGVLFLPTTREEKYKAKQAIDTFFVRSGDVLSTATVALGVNVIALSTTGFALFNLGLVGVWLALSWAVGKRYTQLSGDAPDPA